MVGNKRCSLLGKPHEGRVVEFSTKTSGWGGATTFNKMTSIRKTFGRMIFITMTCGGMFMALLIFTFKTPLF